VSASQDKQIIKDDRIGCDLDDPVRPSYVRLGFSDDLELVQRDLRPQFLGDANRCVRDHDKAEHRICKFAEHQDDNQENGDDRIEPGEDVRSQNACDGSAFDRLIDVDEACRDALINLG
jgi:hypothetical protein